MSSRRPAGSMIPAGRPRAGTAGASGSSHTDEEDREQPLRRPVRASCRDRRAPARPVGRPAVPALRGTGRPWSRSSGAPAPRRPRRRWRPRGPTCRRTRSPRTASAPRPGSPRGCRASRAGVRVGWWMPRPHRTARGVPPREYAARGQEVKCLPRHDDRGGTRGRESRHDEPDPLSSLHTDPRPRPERTAPVRSRVPFPQLPPAAQPARGVPVRARRRVLRRSARRLPGRLGRLRQRRRRLGAGSRAHRGGDRPGAGRRHRDRRRHPAGTPGRHRPGAGGDRRPRRRARRRPGDLPDDHPRRSRAGLARTAPRSWCSAPWPPTPTTRRSPRRLLDTFDGRDDVTVGGSAVVGLQLGSTVTEDLGRAELLAFPLLVVLSLIFFRGRAALIPLVVAITTVLGTFLVLTGVNQVYGLSIFALNLVMGLGIGLAIDYTLFLVTRYREELATQGPTAGAVAHHDAYGGTHRRLLGQHGRGRPGRADGVPPRVHQVHGARRRHGRRRRRHRLIGDRARDVRPVGREARRARSRAASAEHGPLVPPLARGDAPSRHDRGRNRRGDARPRGAGARGRSGPPSTAR